MRKNDSFLAIKKQKKKFCRCIVKHIYYLQNRLIFYPPLLLSLGLRDYHKVLVCSDNLQNTTQSPDTGATHDYNEIEIPGRPAVRKAWTSENLLLFEMLPKTFKFSDLIEIVQNLLIFIFLVI